MKTSLVIAVAATVAASRVGSAAPLVERADSINWAPCTDLPAPTLCSTLFVPLNHLDKNDNRTIPIAVTKYPATKPSKGAILVNPGGPGGSGRAFARSIGRRLVTAIDNSWDMIGFDPRGVGQSQSVICAETAALQQNFDGQEFIGVPGKPGSVNKETYAAYAEVLAKRCQKWSAYNGEYVKHISTAATARDMDLIREALGQELMNYMGYSYGTFLGMTYANMFPEKIGRFVIDGVVDPVYYTTDIFLKYKFGLQNTNELFEGFCQECALAGPAKCQLANLPSKYPVDGTFDGETGPGKKLAASLKYALENFKSVAAFNSEFPGVVKGYDVIGFIFSRLYGPSRWVDTYQILADLLLNNKPESFRDAWTGGVPDFCPTENVGNNGFYSVRCSDAEDLREKSFDEIVERAANADRSSWLGQKPSLGDALVCKHWTRPVDRYEGPWNNKMKNKILVVSSTLDPVTPLYNAKKVHSILSANNDSYLIIQKGYGHCSLGQPSTCTLKAIGNYLFNGTLLNEGKGATTNCVSDTPVFPKTSLSETEEEKALREAAELGQEVYAVVRT
ncbi:hypothetical protein HDU97_002184 [Phlyctochytrium planicorne]|nr:hypothetical protein HDU97_002184 [Phlyctochytrium planicorne]